MIIHSTHVDAWVIQSEEREGIYNFIGDCNVLGVNDNKLEGFSYYPNPTSDRIFLNSLNNIEKVSILNMLGQRVMETKIDATTSEINTSELAVGTYLLEVKIDGQIGTYKIIKN